MRTFFLAVFSMLVVASGASCGGKVVLDTSNTTGSGGTGGAVTATGSGGFATSGSGTFCASEGDVCNTSADCCSGLTCDSSDQCE